MLWKWPRFANIIFQKGLEVRPRDGTSTLVTIFILGLLIADSLTKEKGCKQDTIRVNSPYYVKIVFVLLIEMITVYIQFSIVLNKKLGL